MRAVLIGSAAFQPDYADIDLIADQEFVDSLAFPLKEKHELPLGTNYIYQLNKPLEIYVPKMGTARAQLLTINHENQREISGMQVAVPTLPLLAALKKAHLIIHHKWERHIRTYLKLKELMGVEVFEPQNWGAEVETLYKTHRQEIQATQKKLPKLNVSKDYFFEDAVFKIFDHDDIHRAIALGSVPAYTLMQDGEVWCSKKKWLAMSHEDKVRCVIEETCVLALERSIIPALYLNNKFRGAQWAYEFALSKVCTTITSGWFREFAIEHCGPVLKARPDYVAKFFTGLKQGQIKILKPEVVCGTNEAQK